MRQLPVVNADDAHDPGARRTSLSENLLNRENVRRMGFVAAPIGRLEHFEEPGPLEILDIFSGRPSSDFPVCGAFPKNRLQITGALDEGGAIHLFNGGVPDCRCNSHVVYSLSIMLALHSTLNWNTRPLIA